MSKLSTTKGKVFERKIASILRARWPDATVRRSSQADRAVQSDVYITGGPAILGRLWIEANDARSPQPMAKLVQAYRDVRSATSRDRLPVVIWHRLRERTINVTVPLWVIDVVRGETGGWSDAICTLSLDDFLSMLPEAV